MGNLQASRGTGVHPLTRVRQTLVIANYATGAKPSLVLPCKYVGNWNDVDIRVETAAGNLRGVADATSTRNQLVVEIRSLRGEQLAATVGNHTQAQVVAAVGNHTQVQVVAAILDHPVHAHDLISQGLGGAVGVTIGYDAIAPTQLEDGGAAALHTWPGGGATGVQDFAAMAHAVGGAPVVHGAGGAPVAHATIANAYAEDREIADQAVAATIIVEANGYL